MSLLIRYTGRIYGGITFTGNTLGLSRKSNQQQPGKEHIAGAYITTDNSIKCNNFPFGTTCNYTSNSSEAVLRLPPNTEVVYAELIWGGTSKTPAGDVYENLNDSIKFKPPGASEVDVIPALETRFNEKMVSNSEIYCYTRSAIVTDYVRSAGAGVYKVSHVPAFLDLYDFTSQLFGGVGWTLAVVYRYLLTGYSLRSIALYVGSLVVMPNTPPKTALMGGFVTPNNDSFSARLLLSAAEGDYDLTGDSVFFGTIGNANIDLPLSGANNLSNNFFASQINDDTGALDKSGTFGTRNHYLSGEEYVGVDAARQGWDITNIDVSNNMDKNKNIAILKVSNDQDAILVNGAAIVIDTSEPYIKLNKICTRNHAELGDEVLYIIEIKNIGTANANTVTVTDSIPNGMSFVTGSVIVDGIKRPELDIRAPYGVPLINIAPGSPDKVISFKLKVDSVEGITEYKNRATAVYTYYHGANPYTAFSNYAFCYPVNPGLEVVKTVSEAVVSEGEIIHYQFEVRNTGNIKLTNVIATDILHDGLKLDPSSVKVDGNDPVGSLDKGILISQIDKGDTIMIGFKAEVLNATCGPFENEATAIGQYTVCSEEPRPIEDTSNTVITDCINVRLEKTVDKECAQTGDELKYTVTFTNNSSVDMYDVKIADTISPKTTLVPGSIVPTPQLGETLATGVSVTSPGGLVPGNVLKGEFATLEFRVTVNAGETGEIINSAIATYKFRDRFGIERSGSVGPATVTTVIVTAGLEIEKTADKTYVTQNGEEVVYTLVITNTGDVEITDITVTDPIPDGMTYKPNSTLKNDTLPYTNENPALGINIGDLNPGESYKIQFTVTVSL